MSSRGVGIELAAQGARLLGMRVLWALTRVLYLFIWALIIGSGLT
jgi:hypothetical protein